MKKIINKLMSFIGLNSVSECLFNSFIIGNKSYLVFELPKEDCIINNLIVEKILCNNEFFWFRDYYEFEKYIDLLDPSINGYLFIIIG